MLKRDIYITFIFKNYIYKYIYLNIYIYKVVNDYG